MPAKSKAQFKFMKAVEYGDKNIKKPKGLSRKEAAEFTKGQKGKKYSELPAKVKSKKSRRKK